MHPLIQMVRHILYTFLTTKCRLILSTNTATTISSDIFLRFFSIYFHSFLKIIFTITLSSKLMYHIPYNMWPLHSLPSTKIVLFFQCLFVLPCSISLCSTDKFARLNVKRILSSVLHFCQIVTCDFKS